MARKHGLKSVEKPKAGKRSGGNYNGKSASVKEVGEVKATFVKDHFKK